VNRAGEAAVALTAAVVLGGTIGWLLRGGSSDGVDTSTTTSVGASVSAEEPSVATSASAPASSAEASTPSRSAASGGPSSASSIGPSIVGSPGASVVVTAGAVTVTATPSSAGKFEPIQVYGSVAGVTPGTTLEFIRQGGDTLATTQVGKAGAYRLTVKLGRSGTFVVQAVDGPTVLASSAPFVLTVR
jgi:hypothetical protein